MNDQYIKKGAGLAPAGYCVVGFGEYEYLERNTQLVAQRQIIDKNIAVESATGNFISRSIAEEMVYFCLATALNSAAIPTLGTDVLNLQTIPDNYKIVIRDMTMKALSMPISQGFIKVNNIEVEQSVVNPNSISILVSYTDLNTNNNLSYEQQL